MSKYSDFLLKHIKHITWIYMAIIIFLLAFFIKRGDDFAFHAQRLNAIASELKSGGIGALPIRLYHETLNNYGYASPIFYGDIFMWPFAFLIVCGLSLINAYKLMYISIFLATYFTSSFSMKKIFGDGKTADVAVFMYMVSAPICGITIGSAVGRAFAMIFVPLAICGIYLILNDKNNNRYDWLYLAVGVSGLIFSNMIDAAICVFTLFMITLFCVKKLNIHKIGKILFAAFVCAVLSFWFIAPLLELTSGGGFFFNNEFVTRQVNNLGRFTIPIPGGILFPSSMLKIIYGLFGKADKVPVAYMDGSAVIILVIIFAIIYRKKVLNDSFYMGVLILLCFYLFFQTKLFSHDAVKNIIGIIQFPYRVKIVVAFICAVITAKIYISSNGKAKSVSAIMSVSVFCMVMVIVGSFVIPAVRSIKNDQPYFDYSFSSTDIGAADYIPDVLLDKSGKKYNGYYQKMLTERGEKVTCSDTKTKVEFKRENNKLIVKYDNNNNESAFELPLLMYKGYYAEDVDSKEEIPVEMSKNGLVQFKTANRSGTVEVWYKGTMLQHLSTIISICGLILLCAALLIMKKGKFNYYFLRKENGNYHIVRKQKETKTEE